VISETVPTELDLESNAMNPPLLLRQLLTNQQKL